VAPPLGRAHEFRVGGRAVEGEDDDGVEGLAIGLRDVDGDGLVGLGDLGGPASEDRRRGYPGRDGGKGKRPVGPAEDVDVDFVVLVGGAAGGNGPPRVP